MMENQSAGSIARTVFIAKDEAVPFGGERAHFEYPEGMQRIEPPAAPTQVQIDEAAQADQAQLERDSADLVLARRDLHREWGPEYGARIAEIQNLVNTLPENLRERLYEARTKSGKALFNTPRAFDLLRRLADIGKYRRENRTTYNSDSATQQEERQLLDSLIKAADSAK